MVYQIVSYISFHVCSVTGDEYSPFSYVVVDLLCTELGAQNLRFCSERRHSLTQAYLI